MGSDRSPLGQEESMIERVAKAILTAASPTGAYDEIAFKDTATILARAAIEAMREPTMAQYEALSATGLMWRELNSTKVWQTYIDAALTKPSAAAPTT